MVRAGPWLGGGLLLLSAGGCAPAESEVASSAGLGGCGGPAHAIGHIQGTGSESPFLGSTVEVEGVVTAASWAGPGAVRGFYLESATVDADARSSEALFVVLDERREPPQPRQRVRVRGRVTELRTVTGIDSVEILSDCGRAEPRPTPVSFEALSASGSLEAWESMWVTSREVWTLLDAARFWSHAEVTATLGNRPYGSGHELGASGADAPARIFRVRDPDAVSARWTPPAPETPRLRAGARAAELQAIVELGPSPPALLATSALDWQSPTVAPPLAPAADARRIASLNLHNYFVTLGSRGARSGDELARQRDKLVATLLGLDADIVALLELENDGVQSLEDLGAALNQRLSPSLRYAWSSTLPSDGSPIRAALLYRPARVQPLGDAWFEAAPVFRRAPLFQKFTLDNSELCVGVVHLKSKRCADASSADDARAECGEAERLAEARALAGLLGSSVSARAGDAVMLVGDFNSDALEAPMLELRAAGLSDLLASVAAPERYSYVYRGRASLLDHALGSARVARAVARAAIWHVNADEPFWLDYRTDGPTEPPEEESSRGPERSSDHDPILVDLSLAAWGGS